MRRGEAQTENMSFGCEVKSEFSRFSFKMNSPEPSSKTTEQGGGKALRWQRGELHRSAPCRGTFSLLSGKREGGNRLRRVLGPTVKGL